MKMSRMSQKSIVLAFFLGVLGAIFLPVVITDNPINNNSDNLAVPATESISIGPALKLVEDIKTPPLKN